MSSLAGTGTLIRLFLRRDRVLLAIWVALVVLVPIGMAASFVALYTTAEALKAFAAESMGTPSAVALLGSVYSPTLGGLVAWRTGLNSAILIGPVSILFVIRHTRTEEAAGRLELAGSAPVGRLAPLAAALAVVFVASLLIAALIAGGLIAIGLPTSGSIVLGLTAASCACVFAAVAAVTAQLAESPGAARGLALAAFAALYVLRMPGDLGGEESGLAWLTWLSPIGWLRLSRAYAGDQWWVLALPVALAVVLVALAATLSVRRDLGSGLLPPRVGPAGGAPGLRSPLALAWRLHRGSLIAWSAAALALGLLGGSVGRSLAGFADTAPQVKGWMTAMGARDVGDAFLFIMLYVLGQVVAAYAMSTALRLRSEEVSGRADPVLAAAVGRSRWAASHLAFALVGSAALLGVLGLALGLAYGLTTGNVGQDLPRLLARAMVTLPAVWVMVGIAAALFGLLPRLSVLGTWALLAFFLVLELGWELRQVSQSAFDLSPFAHVHWAVEASATSLVGLSAAAAALVAIGLLGFRRREIGY